MPVAFYAAWLPRSFTLSTNNYLSRRPVAPGTWQAFLTDPDMRRSVIASLAAGGSRVVCSPSKPALLNHFLELRTEHINLTPHSVDARSSIGMNEVATERDLKPVALLTVDNEFVVPE